MTHKNQNHIVSLGQDFEGQATLTIGDTTVKLTQSESGLTITSHEPITLQDSGLPVQNTIPDERILHREEDIDLSHIIPSIDQSAPVDTALLVLRPHTTPVRFSEIPETAKNTTSQIKAAYDAALQSGEPVTTAEVLPTSDTQPYVAPHIGTKKWHWCAPSEEAGERIVFSGERTREINPHGKASIAPVAFTFEPK